MEVRSGFGSNLVVRQMLTSFLAVLVISCKTHAGLTDELTGNITAESFEIQWQDKTVRVLEASTQIREVQFPARVTAVGATKLKLLKYSKGTLETIYVSILLENGNEYWTTISKDKDNPKTRSTLYKPYKLPSRIISKHKYAAIIRDRTNIAVLTNSGELELFVRPHGQPFLDIAGKISSNIDVSQVKTFALSDLKQLRVTLKNGSVKEFDLKEYFINEN